MVFHGIEQYSVHVEQYGFQIDLGKMMGCEILMDILLKHDDTFL